jgi:hypothetical protein
MEQNMISFLRRIVLTPFPVDQSIREEALDLLFNSGEKLSRVTIKYPGYLTGDPIRTVTISRETYKKASDLLRAGMKINAIKEIRAEAKLGLKEAKEATDIWDFNL